VLGAALAAGLVLAATAYAGRGWIREQWCLFQLSRGSGVPAWPLVVELYHRKCAAVTPHLLARYRAFDVPRRKGGVGLSSENEEWKDRVRTLARLEPGCVPHLVEDLKQHARDGDCLLVLDVLQELGPGAAGAIPQVIDLIDQRGGIRDTKWIVEEALKTLLAIGTPGPAFCKVSARLLRQARERKDVYWTIKVLERVRELPAGVALPLLPELLELERWARNSPERELDEGWHTVSIVVFLIFGRLGAGAHQAVPVLEEALQDEVLRPWAALALGCIVPEHRVAMEALVEELSHAEKDGWIVLVSEMPWSTPPLPALLPHLARGLELMRDGWDARIVVKVMNGIDPEFTRRTLLALLESNISEQRLVVLRALLDSADWPPDFPRKLRLLGEDPDPRVAVVAAAALSRAGEASAETLRVYAAQLRSASPEDWEFAAALGQLARSRVEARAIVLAALAEGSGAELMALETAAWMSPDDPEVRQAIERLRGSADIGMRGLAEQALERLEKARATSSTADRGPAP
jgi:hypothetical protein